MADIFDELNEDLRAERATAMMKRYGLLGAVALLVVLAGVGGWKAWEYRKGQAALAVAGPFLEAMHGADALPPGSVTADGLEADVFARIAATAPDGYRSLARLREAALRWDAGDAQAALAAWDQTAADPAADPLLRDLATLLWAQHSIDTGTPAEIAAHTAKLEAGSNIWRPLAQEVDALVALRQDDKAKATALLRQLAVDPLAANGLRGRAAAMLTLLGVTPEARG